MCVDTWTRGERHRGVEGTGSCNGLDGQIFGAGGRSQKLTGEEEKEEGKRKRGKRGEEEGKRKRGRRGRERFEAASRIFCLHSSISNAPAVDNSVRPAIVGVWLKYGDDRPYCSGKTYV